MTIGDPHVLPDDVEILPVRELDAETRAKLGCEEDDFAVSRPRSRTVPKIVDRQAGELLLQFAQPRTIVDAIVEFSTARNEEPEQLLVDAYPMLQRFLRAGLLVETGSQGARRITTSLNAGDVIQGWEIVEAIHVLEDVELYQVRDATRSAAAMKIVRRADPEASSATEREALVLAHLDGSIAPRLLSSSAYEGRAFVVMEWRSGVDACRASEELRSAEHTEFRPRLLRLCKAIAEAYAVLHGRGIIHGDVHDRNLLIAGDASMTLLDFGLARAIEPTIAHLRRCKRGGVGAYFEPEFAAAYIDGRTPPQTSERGEQYSVAALLYAIFTGFSYVDFAPDRRQAMRQIAHDGPRSFAQLGLAPFPALENVFGKALSKDPAARFRSMGEFAAALRSVGAKRDRRASRPGRAALSAAARQFVADTLDELRPSNPLFQSGLQSTPTCSITFGSAGIACALYRIAMVCEDAAFLSMADVWATRAVNDVRSRHAWYDGKLGITRETIGTTSLYHTEAGLHVIRALIARAMGDFVSMQGSVSSFLRQSRRPTRHVDLTLGQAGMLLGSALLVEAIPEEADVDAAGIRRFGDRVADRIWLNVRNIPRLGAHSPLPNLGIAHGWAGLLYAQMRWLRAQRREGDDRLHRRLQELAACAEPYRRGARWRWLVPHDGHVRDHGYMPGWCNGSAGLVHVWLQAYELLGEARYLDLANAAAWNAWEDDVDESHDLCCGSAGRAYALLAMFRASGDHEWLSRATALADGIALDASADAAQLLRTNPALYKGSLGAAVLISDLERPHLARMPLFESEGWPLPPPSATQAGDTS